MDGPPCSAMQVDEECVLRSADSSDPRELLKLVELQAYVTQLNTLKQQNKQVGGLRWHHVSVSSLAAHKHSRVCVCVSCRIR